MTRVWDEYWRLAVMPTICLDPKPDVIIVNSCLWDLTRYKYNGGVKPYRDNIHKMLTEMRRSMPSKTLFIWNTTLPLRYMEPMGSERVCHRLETE